MFFTVKSMRIFQTIHEFSTCVDSIYRIFINVLMWITKNDARPEITSYNPCSTFVNIKLSTFFVLF